MIKSGSVRCCHDYLLVNSRLYQPHDEVPRGVKSRLRVHPWILLHLPTRTFDDQSCYDLFVSTSRYVCQSVYRSAYWGLWLGPYDEPVRALPLQPLAGGPLHGVLTLTLTSTWVCILTTGYGLLSRSGDIAWHFTMERSPSITAMIYGIYFPNHKGSSFHVKQPTLLLRLDDE